MKTISLITCCYNSEKTIERSLLSIQKGIIDIDEHVIIDGKSTDETIQRIKLISSDKKILIKSEKDNGIYHALNKGIRLCNSDWVGVLHSDDEFDADFNVKNIISNLSHDVNFIYGNISMFKNGKLFRVWKPGLFSKIKLYSGWMPPHPTVFIRSDFLKDIGFYNEKYLISSDYEFLVRCMMHKDFNPRYYNKNFVKMYMGGASTSGFKSEIKKMKEDFKICQNYFQFPYIITFLKKIRKLNQFKL
ncbi:glycosyltransferase [Amylibacter sp.]|jgi:glycosyltransferase|nr:glycosyltransferase [Amylibacter sp.]